MSNLRQGLKLGHICIKHCEEGIALIINTEKFTFLTWDKISFNYYTFIHWHYSNNSKEFFSKGAYEWL